MSSHYEHVERRRRTAGGYGASGRRTTFGYWVPLALTVTVATVGLAAWIWSERNDDEDEPSGGEQYPGGVPPPGYTSMSGGLPPGPMPGSFQGGPPPPGPMGAGPPPNPGSFQGVPPPPGPMGAGPVPGYPGPPGTEGYARSTGVETQEDATLMGRMSGMVKRAPSPGQSYDWASKQLAAGVAAAGALVGGALTSIREGEQDDFKDHERWSEEADSQDNGREPKPGVKRRGTSHEYFEGQVDLPKGSSISSKKRKTVAIVVSAVEHETVEGGEVGQHAVSHINITITSSTNLRLQSILSHLPHHVDHTETRVFVLIYSPDLKQHPLSSVGPSNRGPGSSMASSFSNIAHEEAQQPADLASDPNLSSLEPRPIDETTPLFKTLYTQSQALVEKDTMIMPFTTPSGHLHILRSLQPETVYIQESLGGRDGEIVSQLSNGWVKQTVVVVGDEGGLGGLIDSEDEIGLENQGKESKVEDKWWQKEERTGLGKRVAVVDSLRVGEDWRRRVSEHD